MEYKFLAIVNDQFELTPEVMAYFKSHQISILKYWKNLKVVQFSSPSKELPEDLKYFIKVEPDQQMMAFDDEE